MSEHLLSEYLKPENMIMDLKSTDKFAVINALIDKLAETGALKPNEVETAKEKVLERENIGSTGIGNGVAMHHARVDFTEDFICAYAHIDGGIDFAAIDGEEVYGVFLILSPMAKNAEHIEIIKELAAFSREPLNFNFLKTCASAESVIDLLKDWKED